MALRCRSLPSRLVVRRMLSRTIHTSSSSGSTNVPAIPSLSFSGAGFLACYHLGVVAALREHHQLQLQATPSAAAAAAAARQQQPQRIAGVSGGALVAAAVQAHISTDDGMQAVLAVSREARSHPLDALHPGFSLIDCAELAFGRLLREAVAGNNNNNNNNDCAANEFLNRVNQGQQLWIGLTDRRVFNPIKNYGNRNPHDAFLWVDRYRCVEDVIAACMLSSYIPFLTGPARGNQCTSPNRTVQRCASRLEDMIRHGCVKHSVTGKVLTIDEIEPGDFSSSSSSSSSSETAKPPPSSPTQAVAREIGWDGGLVDAFPVLDQGTVVVSPVAICHSSNQTISPALEYVHSSPATSTTSYYKRSIPISPSVRLHLSTRNMYDLRCMTFSSDDAVLQAKFAQGHDNATQFLQLHNLIDCTQHSVPLLVVGTEKSASASSTTAS